MRLPFPRFALACLVCLGSLSSVFSQTDSTGAPVDQMFDAPQADTETASGDAGQFLKEFHAQPLTVTGSFTSSAAMVVGLTDKTTNNVSDGSFDFGLTPDLGFMPSLTFVARPDETIRFQGTVSFPFSATSMFAPDINEIFFDYTFKDSVYFRIGRHLVSWGVARIFDGGDLMTNSSNGLNFKASVPIGSGGMTAVLLTPTSVYTDGFSWGILTYGLQGDFPIGKAEIILSGTYYGEDSASKPLRATAVIKTSLLGVDLFAEGIGNSSMSYSPSFSASPAVSGVLGGFFWERSDPECRLYGEYYFNASDSSMRDHQVSVIAGANNAFGTPFNLGLQWTHAFIDNSGIVVPGFTLNIWRHISLQVGLPFRYGAIGSYYLRNGTPTVQTGVIRPQELTNWDQRYGILLRLTLSTGF